MSSVRLPILLLVVALACSRVTGGNRQPVPRPDSCCSAQALANGKRIADEYRVAALAVRRFTYSEFWRAAADAVNDPVFQNEEIGRSVLGRSIRAITYGSGPTRVLLWSQMHGDESTATMALADILRYLAQGKGDPLRERLRRELTIVFVPMLNPDGAELWQRENAAGIDINRDARRLATPEGQALKRIRDRFRPAFGFNLHDQNARTRAGGDGPAAAIALLAPAYNTARDYNEVRSRARLVAATVAQTLKREIPRRIAKYNDSFTPRAFGDLMQKWGTSTVLIESGALPDDPQKQRLRKLNVAGLLVALDAIATGTYSDADTTWYEGLPDNSGGAVDLLVTGGMLVLPGVRDPVPADLAINYEDAVAHTGPRIRDAGDLRETIAIDTIDARGLYLHPGRGALSAGPGGVWLRIGAPAEIDIRKGPALTSPLVKRLGPGALPE